MSNFTDDSANESENIKREKTQAQEIEIRHVNALKLYSPFGDDKQDFMPEKQEIEHEANFEFKEKIKKYVSSGIKPQIKGEYFKNLMEGR